MPQPAGVEWVRHARMRRIKMKMLNSASKASEMFSLLDNDGMRPIYCLSNSCRARGMRLIMLLVRAKSCPAMPPCQYAFQPVCSNLRIVSERVIESAVTGGGSLDRKEMAVGLFRLGVWLQPSELAALMEALDEDGGGEIDLAEFSTWWEATPLLPPRRLKSAASRWLQKIHKPPVDQPAQDVEQTPPTHDGYGDAKNVQEAPGVQHSDSLLGDNEVKETRAPALTARADEAARLENDGGSA